MSKNQRIKPETIVKIFLYIVVIIFILSVLGMSVVETQAKSTTSQDVQNPDNLTLWYGGLQDETVGLNTEYSQIFAYNHANDVRGLHVTNNLTVWSGLDNGNISEVDRNGNLLVTHSNHSVNDEIWSVSYDPQRDYILAGVGTGLDDSHSAYVIENSTGNRIWQKNFGSGEAPHAYAVVADDNHYFIGLENSSVLKVDPESGNIISVSEQLPGSRAVHDLINLENSLVGITDGTANEDDPGFVFKVNKDTMEIENKVRLGAGDWRAVNIFKGKYYATARAFNSTVEISSDFKIQRELLGTGRDISVAGDKMYIATTSSSGSIKVYNESAEVINTITQPSEEVYSLDSINQSGSDPVTDPDSGSSNISIEIRFHKHMYHDTKQKYEVADITNNLGVTDKTTVTSSDPSVVTVDEQNNTLIATNDTNISKQITITAEYQGESTTRKLTVSDLTLDNVDILPAFHRFLAFISNTKMQYLVFLTVTATVIARESSEWVGIGVLQAGLILGWTPGWVNYGVILSGIILLSIMRMFKGRSNNVSVELRR